MQAVARRPKRAVAPDGGLHTAARMRRFPTSRRGSCASRLAAVRATMGLRNRSKAMPDTRARKRGWRRACGVAMTLLITTAAHDVMAGDVYRCTQADGHVAYQDHACSGSEREKRIEIAPAPAPGPAPDYRLPAPAHASRATVSRTAGRRGQARSESVMSFECRAANGEVFYRHGACPHSIKEASDHTARHAGGRGRGNGRESRAAGSVAVSARALPRSEVCKRLERSFARAGHERDETVSTYEHNAGRDPCRNF